MTKCNHKNIVPLEYTFGKVGFTKSPEPYDKVLVWDEYNLMSCHRMRVTVFYCPECATELHVSTKLHNKEILRNEKNQEEIRPSTVTHPADSNPDQLRPKMSKWQQSANTKHSKT